MTDLERLLLRHFLETHWEDVRAAYRAAGTPFGPGRGVEIWAEYEQRTTVN